LRQQLELDRHHTTTSSSVEAARRAPDRSQLARLVELALKMKK
jgi:hypothetical protein